MPRSRRIVVIIGIGAFLISAELLAFRSLNRSLDKFLFLLLPSWYLIMPQFLGTSSGTGGTGKS